MKRRIPIALMLLVAGCKSFELFEISQISRITPVTNENGIAVEKEGWHYFTFESDTCAGFGDGSLTAENIRMKYLHNFMDENGYDKSTVEILKRVHLVTYTNPFGYKYGTITYNVRMKKTETRN